MREKLLGAFRVARRTIVSFVKDYIVIVRGRAEGAGLATAGALLRAGPLGWLGLLTLLFNVIVTAYLVLQGQAHSTLQAVLWEGERVSLPSPALPFSLLFISLGWAYVLCGAALVGPWVYLIVAAYVAYYGLYAGISLADTFWFAFPSLWMLVLGAWAAASSTDRWRRPFLLALSLLTALLTYGSLGLAAVVPAELGTWGKLALGALYFALVANPWVLKRRPLKLGLVWAISSAVFAAFYAISLWQSPDQEVLVNVFLAANGLLGLVSLFWYWVGLDLFNGAQDVAEWLVGSINALVPRQILTMVVFPLWFIWAIIARYLAFTPPLRVVECLGGYSWGRALLRFPLRLPMDLLSALEYHFYVTLVIALVTLALWCVKRLSAKSLIWLFGLSAAAFFVLWGYFSSFFAVASEGRNIEASLWPVIVYVGGMFWQVLKVSPGLLASERSSSVSETRLFLFLGFLLLLGGVSLLELSAGHGQFEQELSLNPIFGVLYLGLPYLLYTFLYQQKHYTPVPSRQILLLFILGMLSAIPALLLEKAFLTPVFWSAGILGTVWHSGRWDESWDGLVYVTALALGFVAFYTHPIFIPIPAFTAFLGHLANLQQRYMLKLIYPWDFAWWRITLGILGAALILGYLLAKARLAEGRRGLLFALLGLIASLAFLGVYELAFGL